MKPLYTCICLDGPSINKAVEIAETFHPRHYKTLAEHITLEFGYDHNPNDFPLGKNAQVKVIGYARDEKVQCLKVKILDESIICANKHPHLTISVSPQGRPVQSNDLLQKNSFIEVIDGPILIGIVAYYDDSGDGLAKLIWESI